MGQTYTPVAELHVTVWNHVLLENPMNGPPAKFDINACIAAARDIGTRTLSGTSAFNVHFRGLIPTRETILACVFDGGALNRLREHMRAEGIRTGCYSPDQPLFPNIVHVSLARFTDPNSVVGAETKRDIIARFANWDFGRLTVRNIALRHFRAFAIYESAELLTNYPLV